MNILILSTYPADNPMHGGQHRLFNIIKKYKSLGHNVVNAGILGSERYSSSNTFLNYPYKDFNKISYNTLFMEDCAIFNLLRNNDSYYYALCKKLDEIFDVIHVEQPWMMPFAIKYKELKNCSVKIIYGSQNIECNLKKRILLEYFSDENIEFKVSLVEEAEKYAIKASDFCIAVSKYDASWIKEHTHKKVYIIPNGVIERKNTGRSNFEGVIKEFDSFALYCASGHPPNITGFLETFKEGFGCMRPDQRLIIVGSVCESLESNPQFNNIANMKIRTLLLGEVSENDLAFLLNNAKVVILPILSGSGTNLKTAEAIWNKSYVVATPKAMIGYEEFIGEEGIIVEETSLGFRKQLRRLMNLDRIEITTESANHRKKVLWDSCLSQLSVVLHDIFA